MVATLKRIRQKTYKLSVIYYSKLIREAYYESIMELEHAGSRFLTFQIV